MNDICLNTVHCALFLNGTYVYYGAAIVLVRLAIISLLGISTQR